MSNFVKRVSMIAKIRLITNASAIEDAYMALEQFNGLGADERRGLRKPRIPKSKYHYTPMAIEPAGIKLAFLDGDIIQMKHSDNPDWIPLKNEPGVWSEIQGQLNNVKVGGFGKNK
jgi:hypothetical protein